jgi:hypothetical protein
LECIADRERSACSPARYYRLTVVIHRDRHAVSAGTNKGSVGIRPVSA